MRPYLLALLSVFLVACRSQHIHSLKSDGQAGYAMTEPLNWGVQYANGRPSDTVALGLSVFEGKTYFFETTEAVLNGTPRWNTNADFPPLSPRKAEAAARSEAQQLRPDVATWWLETIELRPIIDGCWCYAVRLTRGDVAITGMPYFLTVPVLMSGQAVQGALQQRDLQK